MKIFAKSSHHHVLNMRRLKCYFQAGKRISSTSLMKYINDAVIQTIKMTLTV